MDHHPVDTTFRKHYYYQTIFFYQIQFISKNKYIFKSTKPRYVNAPDGLKNVLNLKDTQDLHPYVKKTKLQTKLYTGPPQFSHLWICAHNNKNEHQ